MAAHAARLPAFRVAVLGRVLELLELRDELRELGDVEHPVAARVVLGHDGRRVRRSALEAELPERRRQLLDVE